MTKGGAIMQISRIVIDSKLNAVFLLELIDTTTGIDKLLLTCIERVAVGANLNAQVLFNRTGLKCIPTSTSYCGYMISRMNSLFHIQITSFRPESFAETELN